MRILHGILFLFGIIVFTTLGYEEESNNIIPPSISINEIDSLNINY